MNGPHAQRAHALFAPSSAHRWLACPASVRLIEAQPALPRKQDPAADFGTLCHEIAELVLKKGMYKLDPTDDQVLVRYQQFAQAYPNDTASVYTMDRLVETLNQYLNYIEERLASVKLFDAGAQLKVESRVTVVRGKCFGTVDAYLSWLNEDGIPCLEVVDLKTGVKPVEAKENPQLLTYAIGVHRATGAEAKQIVLTIVQPDRYDVAASGSVSTWETDAATLLDFEAKIRTAIKTYEKAEPHIGEHCTHCPVFAVCPAQHRRVLETLPAAPTELPPATALSPQQLSFVLQHKNAIIAWLEACEELALVSPPPGWRVVEGTPRRKMRDKQAVIEVLTSMRLSKELLIATEERVVTVTEAERRLKQHPDREAILAKIIEYTPGAPKLMPVVGENPVDLLASNPVAAP